VLAWGAAGYGGTVLLQNTGITRTSVSHAALLIGTAPVMVAIIAVVWHRSLVRPVAWAGFAVSLGGVGLIAAGGGGGANLAGDGMVLASVLLSAVFTVGQTRLLRGRDPIAVTAVQFLGAALVTAPLSALTEGVPPAPVHTASLLAVVALIAGGTLVPFTLFAFGQSRLPAEVAGAFLNIEPLVGAVAGVVAFGNPAGPAQFGGGAAILGGIALSSVRRRARRAAGPPAVVPEPALVEAALAEPAPVQPFLPDLTVTEPAMAGTLLAEAVAGPVDRSAEARRQAADVRDGVMSTHRRRPAGDRAPAAATRPAAARPAAARAAAGRHPAGLLRPGRTHGAARPARLGRRRPRGQLPPPSGRQGTRRPGAGRPGAGRPKPPRPSKANTQTR
jgi:drug/metabolite transporter (DMT)-like permease